MKTNCKIIIIFLFVLELGCSRIPQPISKEEIASVLDFFIGEVVYNAHGEKFYISPLIDGNLKPEKILGLRDTLLSKDDVRFMIDQYNSLKGKEIKGYINSEFYNKILDESPNNNFFYYIIDPPLFSLSRDFVIIHATTVFKVENKYKWDNLIFVLENKNGEWSLGGYLHE